MGVWGYIEIIDIWVILFIFIHKDSQSKLDNREVERSFLDPLVELHMVAKPTFEISVICGEPRELAVEGQEIGSGDALEQLREVEVEVVTIEVHWVTGLLLFGVYC
jgi:hypothetical protein